MEHRHEQEDRATSTTRPSMPVARDSGSSGGATERVGGRFSSATTVTGEASTPSDDDTSTAYFHSAASTLAGSGGRASKQGNSQGTSDIEAHIQRMNLSEEGHPASSSSALPPSRQQDRDSGAEATSSSSPNPEEDRDGVIRQDFADQPVNEDHTSSLAEQGASTTHFSVVARSPDSTAPAAPASSSQASTRSSNVHTHTSAGYGKPEQALTGAPRRSSNPFIIQEQQPGEPSATDDPGAHRSSARRQQSGAPAYTSSGPSRPVQQNKATGASSSSSSSAAPAQQAPSHMRQQSRAQKSIPAPNIDAAKQDYFSRHPDPDYGLRHGNSSNTTYSRRHHATGGRPRSSGSHSTGDARGSERASLSGDEDLTSNAVRDRADSSSAHEALLSPALSIGTLSSGVSVGPSMGGYERIFPIRSVVAGQKPLPQPSSSGTARPSGSRNNQPKGGARQGASTTTNANPHMPPVSEASVHSSTATNVTALQAEQYRDTPREAPLNEELEVGTDYSRRSPAPDDVSDFSFDSRGSARGARIHMQPRPDPAEEEAPLNRGDPASLYGTASQTSPGEEREHFASFRVPSATSKPPLDRNDSLISRTTGSSDMAAVSSVSAHASSYPTTSRYSDDSDPTARKGTSTAPSTIAPTPGRGSSLASLSQRPGLTSIPSQDLNSDPELLTKGVNFDPNDPTQAARRAFEKGEAEEGPSVESGGLGSLGVEQDGLFVTARFEHQETEDGHMIVTGRKGELLKCEDEPIHIPGAVQDYGVLIAVEENDEGHFAVSHVSEVSSTKFVSSGCLPSADVYACKFRILVCVLGYRLSCSFRSIALPRFSMRIKPMLSSRLWKLWTRTMNQNHQMRPGPLRHKTL